MPILSKTRVLKSKTLLNIRSFRNSETYRPSYEYIPSSTLTSSVTAHSPHPHGSDKAFWLKKHSGGDGAEAKWKLTIADNLDFGSHRKSSVKFGLLHYCSTEWNDNVFIVLLDYPF